MGLVFLLVFGVVLGWMAAIVMRAEDSVGVLRNVVAGVVGAVIAGLVVSPLLGRGDLVHGVYNVDAMLIALAGSALLLVAVNVGRRDEAR